MEEMVSMLAEKGIIAGAFIYMLYLFLTKFTSSQESIAESQNATANTMLTISGTLQNINVRMELMDRRIERLESGRSDDNIL